MIKVSPNIWALGWVSFFTDLATAMTKPLIPIYVVLILHQGMDKLGYILAITTFVSYLLRWVGGWLSDHFQMTKPFLILGYGLSAVMKPLFSLVSSWQGIAAISAAERLGKAVRSAPKDLLISASAQQTHQGRAFGVHKTLDIAGETMGGIVAFLLLSWLGNSAEWIRHIFEFTLIPGIIGLMILIFFVKDLVSDSAKEQKLKAVEIAAANEATTEKSLNPSTKIQQFDRGLWGWFAVYFLAVFFMMNESFMLMRGSDIGVAIHWLPLLVVAGTLTQTLISYSMGKHIDAKGTRTLMLVGLASAVLSTALLFSTHLIGIILAFILQGVFMVASLNALRARIGQTKNAKGKAYGVFYLGTALATAIGSLLIGELWQQISVTFVLTLTLLGLVVLSVTALLSPKLLSENEITPQ